MENTKQKRQNKWMMAGLATTIAMGVFTPIVQSITVQESEAATMTRSVKATFPHLLYSKPGLIVGNMAKGQWYTLDVNQTAVNYGGDYYVKIRYMDKTKYILQADFADDWFVQR